jgi:hypothetical protein
MIQVGLTLSDENGNFPPGGGTWQFNFKFDLKYFTLILRVLFFVLALTWEFGYVCARFD